MSGGRRVSGLVWSVAVVVDQVLVEYQGQVAVAEDQDPVQEFAAEGADDAFADGVHPWGSRRDGDGPQSFGLEHLGEGGGEQRIAIMNKEPQHAEAVTQVHGEVVGLLHRPGTGRVRGHPGQVKSQSRCLRVGRSVRNHDSRSWRAAMDKLSVGNSWAYAASVSLR